MWLVAITKVQTARRSEDFLVGDHATSSIGVDITGGAYTGGAYTGGAYGAGAYDESVFSDPLAASKGPDVAWEEVSVPVLDGASVFEVLWSMKVAHDETIGELRIDSVKFVETKWTKV